MKSNQLMELLDQEYNIMHKFIINFLNNKRKDNRLIKIIKNLFMNKLTINF